MKDDQEIDHLSDDRREEGQSPLPNEDEPNESEAETEILHASKSNTPRKPLDRLRSTTTQKSLVVPFDAMTTDVKTEGDSEPYMDRSKQAGLKRKARISDPEQLQARGRDGLRSPTKKARLSPEYREMVSSSSESEYEPTLDLRSSHDHGSRKSGEGAGADKRRHRETHSRDKTARDKPARFASPSSSISQSYRASSHEVRPRSSPPHALHKRSSSFQSGLPIVEPARPVRTSRRSHPPLDNSHDTAERRLRSSLHHVQSTDYELHIMANSREMDRNGRTILARACNAGDVDKVKDLLTEATVDVNKGDYAGTCPLHLAATEGHMEIVQLLLNHGCVVDCINMDSETPLVCALQTNHPKIAILLLERKANPWLKDADYNMPMDWAIAKVAEENRPAVTKAIEDAAIARLNHRRTGVLEEHAPVRADGKAKKTYHRDLKSLKEMEEACLVGNEELFVEMLTVRTVPNLDCGLAAAKGGHVGILRRIVERLDPSAAELGQLMLASLGRGNLEVVQYMLSRPNLDCNEKFGGLSFLQLAGKKRGPHMYEEHKMLQQAGKAGFRSGLTNDIGSMNVGSRSDERTALGSVEETTEEAEEGGGRDKRRRLVTGARKAQEVEEEERRMRAEYLDTLPFALKHAFTPPHVPTNDDIKDWDPGERCWKRTLNELHFVHTRKRSQIDPSPPQGTENDEYILNIWPTTYLRHETLSKCKELMPTLPITDNDRRWFSKDTDITGTFLVRDENWQASNNEIKETRNCPHRIHYQKRLGGRVKIPGDRAVVTFNWRPAQEWIKHAGSDELYWVKVKEFIEIAKGCEWLKGIMLRPLNQYPGPYTRLWDL